MVSILIMIFFLEFQLNLLGTGSEPRIINTMMQKGNVQLMNPPPLFNSYEPDEIYRELIRQHKARKFDDPVSDDEPCEIWMKFSIIFFQTFHRNIVNWIRRT